MGLYVGQLCDAVVDTQNIHTLRTTSDRYALLPEGYTEPLSGTRSSVTVTSGSGPISPTLVMLRRRPSGQSRHLQSVYNKLGVNSRTAATAFAFEHGLV